MNIDDLSISGKAVLNMIDWGQPPGWRKRGGHRHMARSETERSLPLQPYAAMAGNNLCVVEDDARPNLTVWPGSDRATAINRVNLAKVRNRVHRINANATS